MSTIFSRGAGTASLRFSGRTPSRFSATHRTFPGRALGLRALAGGFLAALLSELVFRRHGFPPNWLNTGTGKFLVDGHRWAWHLSPLAVIWICALVGLTTVTWWAAARYRHWRRPSVPFTILLTFELLAAATLWPKIGRVGASLNRGLFPEEHLLRFGLLAFFAGALIAWGSAPGRQLLDVTGAPRSAIGFLRTSQMPQRLSGLALMLLSSGTVVWLLMPVIVHPTHPTPGWPPPGPSPEVRVYYCLALNLVFLTGRALWRRTWRAMQAAPG